MHISYTCGNIISVRYVFSERVGRTVRSFLFVKATVQKRGGVCAGAKGRSAGGFMAKGKSGTTVSAVEALVSPALAQLGLRLWDVRFEKEGPDWFLRVLIDRDEPLDMQACEDATRAINPILDEADPIDESYYLEVGSPGLGCKLTRDAHFEAKKGQKVRARLIRPDENGGREIAGILLGKEGGVVTLETKNGPVSIDTKNASYFKLCDDEDLF